MAKTNWQDPKTSEMRSTQISGLQEAVGKLERSIGIDTITETDIPLSEVFISNDDRCRMYQAIEGKRNWILSPTPIIKKNGTIITDDFEIDYGGGAVIFTTPILEDDILTADATYTAPIKDKQLSTEDFTTGEKEVLANLENNIEITKSPIGFPNRTDSTFTFDKATRTFTIEPTAESYEVFFKDKKFIKDSPESVVIPNTTGLYYIYFNQDGILSASTNFPGLQNMIYISYIYWNENQTTSSLQFGLGDERHGTVMDKATHERLHAIDWTQWVRGLQLHGYEMNDSSSNDAPKISITDGVVADEDLFHNISHSHTPSDFFDQVLQDFALLPVIYREGANGEWRQDEATEYPFKNTDSGRVNFNEFDVEWKQSQVPNNDFVAYYIVFSADVEQPIKVVQGQRVDNTLADAQANNDDRDISWGNIPFQEFKVLYRLILQTSDSFTNDRKAMLVDVLDLRTARRSPGGGGIIPSAHSNLTGLGYAESGHTGFASESDLADTNQQLNEMATDITTKVSKNGDRLNATYRLRNISFMSVCDFLNSSIQNAIKIKTKIPATAGDRYTVDITGYQYDYSIAKFIDCQIGFNVGAGVDFYGAGVMKRGNALTPEVKLAQEDGFVVIEIGITGGYVGLSVQSKMVSTAIQPLFMDNWVVVDEKLKETAEKIKILPYI